MVNNNVAAFNTISKNDFDLYFELFEKRSPCSLLPRCTVSDTDLLFIYPTNILRSYTGKVASKLAIVLSIIGPFWLFYVGALTIYGT